MTDIPVLLQGETGTGKGLVAKHILGVRRQLQSEVPFVALSCASLNNDVADATLFGHRRGAFTGAHDNAVGAVGSADGGILFLDEIHCLTIGTQRKLLRVLDDGAYSRVGESLERKARFQLIAATNRDLGGLVHQGDFLLDLLMRIQGIAIDLPPLRERLHDIPALVARYIDSHHLAIAQADFRRLVNLCLPLHWPGNVRQLHKALDAMRFKALIENTTEYAPCFAVDASMQVPKLPEMQEMRDLRDLLDTKDAESALNGNSPTAQAERPDDDSCADLVDELIRDISRVRRCPVDLGRLIGAVESSLIRYSMARNRSIAEVMSHLNLSRGKLDFKRRKYKLMAADPLTSDGQ